VLEVLEREGIRADVVAGVSVGSAVGALYCAGYTSARLKAIAQGLEWSKLIRPCRPRLSLFDTGRLEQYLDELIGGKTFGQLTIPFVALGVDILTMQQVVLKEGRVSRAVRASCAVPGLFPPVAWGEYLLMDGGVMNNLPVQVLREQGAEYVIAVSLMAPVVRRPRPRNFLEMWVIAADAMMLTTLHESADANCVIVPDIGDLSFIDFGNVEELMRRGRLAAETQGERLRRDLRL